MKDNIIILKDICGECEDSEGLIVGVYVIDKPDFDLQKEFVKYLKKFYEDNGLEACIMGNEKEPYVCLRYLLYEHRKEYKGRFRELNKILREIEKKYKHRNSIKYYVEEILKLEKLEVKEYYV